MHGVVVGRDRRAGRLKDRAVANSTVTQQRLPGDGELLGLEHARPGRKDLSAAGVDHRRTRRVTVERGGAGDLDVERQRERACDREADADAGEAAGPAADDDPLDLSGIVDELVDGSQQIAGPRCVRAPVGRQGANGAEGGRGVKGQDRGRHCRCSRAGATRRRERA